MERAGGGGGAQGGDMWLGRWGSGGGWGGAERRRARGWTRLQVQIISQGGPRGRAEALRKAIGQNRTPSEDRPTI